MPPTGKVKSEEDGKATALSSEALEKVTEVRFYCICRHLLQETAVSGDEQVPRKMYLKDAVP